MTSQKIHEALVVRFRDVKQRQHLFITAAGALQSLPDQMLDLILRDQALRVWPRDRFPEIADDDVLQLPRLIALERQRDVIRFDHRPGSCARSRLYDVFQLSNISRKVVRYE